MVLLYENQNREFCGYLEEEEGGGVGEKRLVNWVMDLLSLFLDFLNGLTKEK